MIRNVTFVNFNNGSAIFGITTIQGKTESMNGGFTYLLGNIDIINSTNLVGFRWEHEAVFHDEDGSFTGIVHVYHCSICISNS